MEEPIVSAEPESPVTAPPPGAAESPPSAEPGESLGPISFDPPDQARPDPLGRGNLPDFVDAANRWFIADRVTLTVAIQNKAPLMPDEERTDIQVVSEFQWAVFDVGPRDGSTMMAIAPVADRWVLITAQAWSGSDPGVAQSTVEQVAASVVHG